MDESSQFQPHNDHVPGEAGGKGNMGIDADTYFFCFCFGSIEKIIWILNSSTDTAARYLGLVARIRPLLIPASRYLAYTSDVGEAFRPVVNPKVVTSAYGISIAYVVSCS
jgi:hypothetical protein